jgi:hypothetical protein
LAFLVLERCILSCVGPVYCYCEILHSVLYRETLKSQGPGLWVSLKVLQGDLASMQVKGPIRWRKNILNQSVDIEIIVNYSRRHPDQ